MCHALLSTLCSLIIWSSHPGTWSSVGRVKSLNQVAGNSGFASAWASCCGRSEAWQPWDFSGQTEQGREAGSAPSQSASLFRDQVPAAVLFEALEVHGCAGTALSARSSTPERRPHIQVNRDNRGSGLSVRSHPLSWEGANTEGVLGPGKESHRLLEEPLVRYTASLGGGG